MGKKKGTNLQAKKIAEPENMLPQNIVELGEHSVEDKIIYIYQRTYNEIHNFTKDKLTNESGGVLVGNVIEQFGKTHILIQGFVEAKYCEGTPTTLTFTHESWEYIHKEVDKKFNGYKIIGWIHTHPSFGIFLSEYDRFIQDNYFQGENQIAYVVDPIQQTEGFFFWINGKIERCKGFYVFDKTGVKIKLKQEENSELPTFGGSDGNPLPWKILTGVLTVAVILLVAMCLSINSKINTLQSNLQSSEDATSSSIYSLAEQVQGYLDTIQTALNSHAESINATASEITDIQNAINACADAINSMSTPVIMPDIDETTNPTEELPSDDTTEESTEKPMEESTAEPSEASDSDSISAENNSPDETATVNEPVLNETGPTDTEAGDTESTVPDTGNQSENPSE